MLVCEQIFSDKLDTPMTPSINIISVHCDQNPPPDISVAETAHDFDWAATCIQNAWRVYTVGSAVRFCIKEVARNHNHIVGRIIGPNLLDGFDAFSELSEYGICKTLTVKVVRLAAAFGTLTRPVVSVIPKLGMEMIGGCMRAIAERNATRQHGQQREAMNEGKRLLYEQLTQLAYSCYQHLHHLILTGQV